MNTAQDVVHYLLASTGGGAQDGEHNAVRQAVVHGVREVMLCRDWLWHTKTGVFVTQQPETTATTTANSNQVTVASTTSMVPGRLVMFGGSSFSSAVRIISISGNVITMERASKASESGISARPQTFYDLPGDLRDIDALVTNTVGTLHNYVTPQEWQRLEINTNGTGEPYYYTIMRSDVNPERYQIRFVGVPSAGTPVYYTYRYLPEPMKYMGYERMSRQGTVTVTGESVTVVGTDTDFQPDIAGCAIRFSAIQSGTVVPPEPIGSLTPFTRERVIASWTSATQLTVDRNLSPRTNAMYCISSIIDASPQMYTAILSAADMWYARIANKPVDQPMAMYNRDIRIAMEADTVRPLSGVPSGIAYPTPRSAGWRSLPAADRN